MPVRGRKRSPWAQVLFGFLPSEIERLRAAGLKFNASILKTHALEMISGAPEESFFHPSVVYKWKPLPDKITIRWVQQFMRAHLIVLRSQTVKLIVNPTKLLQI